MNSRIAAFLTIVAISSINALNVTGAVNTANQLKANQANHGHQIVSQPAHHNKTNNHTAVAAKPSNSTADELDYASIAQAEAIIQDLDEIHGYLHRFKADLKNPAVFSEMLKLNTSALLSTLASVNVTQSQDKVNAAFNNLLDEFAALADQTNTTADNAAVKMLAKLQASVVDLKASVAAANSTLRAPISADLKNLDAPLQASVDQLEAAISQNEDSAADIKANLLPSLRADAKAVQKSLEQVSDQLKSVVAAAKEHMAAANKKSNK